MLSRTTIFLASIVAAAAFSACSSTYSNVYSFKKNTFKAPPPRKADIAPPAASANPFQGQPGATPGADPLTGIPGVPAAPAGAPAASPIPGLEAAPGAAPAPAPGAAPAPAPAP